MPVFRPRKAIAIGCCGEPGGEEAPFDRIDTGQYQPINMPAFWGDRPQLPPANRCCHPVGARLAEAPGSQQCSRPNFSGPSGAFQADVAPVAGSDLATIRELFRQRLRRVSDGPGHLGVAWQLRPVAGFSIRLQNQRRIL
jgi:hypothetical protein